MGKDRTLEIIKTEIERLKATNPSEYNYQNAEGYVWALDDILSFLSTLESEKPIVQDELEKEINRYYDDMDGDCRYAQSARHFAKWGAEHTKNSDEKSIPNDLDESTIAKIVMGVITLDDDESIETMRNCSLEDLVIAGAKWQADHTPLPEDTVLFNKGVAEGKRLMMEGAEEYEVGMHGEPIKITFDKYVQRAKGIFPGDKVRVIVCKKED